MANGVEDAETKTAQVDLTPEELRNKIVCQVEFYFGDYNLPKDKFLLSKVSENEGWVDVDTLLKFNRLKKLTTDKALISEALKGSDHGIVEVSEDNLKVRRNPEKPMPTSFKDQFVDRTVYVKGFPNDATLDQLIEFFKPFGSGCIKMRRLPVNRQFKGSVFVLLESSDAAKILCETKDLQYQGTDLILMMAQEHADMRAKKRQESNDNRKKNEEQDELKEMVKAEEMFEKMEKKPGVFLSLTGIPKDSEITFQDFKDALADESYKISYVEFEKGQEEALIRFGSENAAKTAMEKFVKDGKISIKDKEISARVLEGEEEIAQYRRQAEHKASRFETDRNARKRAGQFRNQGYRGRGGGGRRGGDGRRGGEGRRGGDGGPPQKRARRD